MLLNWIQHHGLETLVIYYALSAWIGSAEAPDANASRLYRHWYKFSNAFAANLARAFATKLPSGRLNTAENAAEELPIVPKP